MDAGNKVTLSQLTINDEIGELVATRYDAVTDAVVLGYNLPKPSHNDPSPGHVVATFGYNE